MNVKEHFDVIVVGSDLAPLLCAALLCKRGFRVLVVGGDDRPQLPVPAVTGQLDSPVARRILTELGIAQVVRRKERAIDPHLQIVTPGARISVAPDPDSVLEEFTRELPAERESARLFYTRLAESLESIDEVLGSGLSIPPRGFIEKQRVRRMLAGTEFGYDGLGGRLLGPLSGAPGLRACVFSHVVPSSRLHRTCIAPVHAALLHGRAVRRQVALEDGMAGLNELLAHRISHSRGETKLGDRVEHVEVQKGRVVHVKLHGHESATGCDFLVCGTETSAFAGLLATDGRPMDDNPLVGSGPATAAHLATMKLVVRPEVFPEPMAPLVNVIFDEAAPPFESNLAVLERGRGDEESCELWVTFLLDHERLVRDPRYVSEVARRLVSRLSRVIPFLPDFLIDVEEPEADPRRLPAVYTPSAPGPWSCCAVDYRTRIPNLVVCSAQVVPGFGSEGEWMAAWGAAGLIASRDPSKAKFRSRTQRWSI